MPIFTDLTITYNKAIGNIIGVTVTKEPASLKMEQWNSTKGNWTQNSENNSRSSSRNRGGRFLCFS